MKVLIVSAAFPPVKAGDSYHVLQLANYLAERGLDVHILTTVGNGIEGKFPFQVNPHMRSWSWTELPRLAKCMRVCSPDAVLLIFSSWAYNGRQMIAFAPLLSKILIPRAVFVTQLENEHSQFCDSFFTGVLFKMIRVFTGQRKCDYALLTLLRASDRIIASSQRHLSQLSESLRNMDDKSVVIPAPPVLSICPEKNGESREHARNVLGVKANEFIIAHFGYMYPSKGIEILLEAFKIICRHQNNVRLLTVGGGPPAPASHSYIQQLHESLKQREFHGKIIETGEFPWDSNKGSLYLRAADACVLPFISGVSLNRSSVAAAAAHGLPIITTKGQILESAFVNRKNVLLCPPNNERALAEAIESLIADPELRQRLSVGARDLAHRWFSWDNALDQTIKALKNS